MGGWGFWFFKKLWENIANFHIFKPYSQLTNLRFGWSFLHNLQRHVSHFHFLVFTLNSSREAASLYSDGSFAQIDRVLYVTVSIPEFTVLLKSVECTLKFLKLYSLLRNLKRELTGWTWWGEAISNFINLRHWYL